MITICLREKVKEDEREIDATNTLKISLVPLGNKVNFEYIGAAMIRPPDDDFD